MFMPLFNPALMGYQQSEFQILFLQRAKIFNTSKVIYLPAFNNPTLLCFCMNTETAKGCLVYLSLMWSQTLVHQGEKGGRVAGIINYSEGSPLGLLTNKGDAQDKSINPFTPKPLHSRLHLPFLPRLFCPPVFIHNGQLCPSIICGFNLLIVDKWLTEKLKNVDGGWAGLALW